MHRQAVGINLAGMNNKNPQLTENDDASQDTTARESPVAFPSSSKACCCADVDDGHAQTLIF
jgi:hypothetical protein